MATGCGDGDSATAPPTPLPARPTTVTVSPATHELTALGTTVQLSAEVRDQMVARAIVTWTSSSNLVATVDASGLVTAAGNGTATITASMGSASGSAVVTVSGGPKPGTGTVRMFPAGTILIRSASITSSPYRYETGYLDGDRILVSVDWYRATGIRADGTIDWDGEAPFRIRGVPYLELQVGEHVRPAVMVAHWPDRGIARFRYNVGRDDHDADGIGFAADAIQLVNGAAIFDPATGDPLPIDLSEHAVENHDSHKVRPHDPFPGSSGRP